MATSAPQYVTQLDPNLNTQLLTAQQRLALAQGLQKQSMQPIQAPGGQNGRISWLSALAQGLNAYNSKGMIDDATQSLGDAQSKIAQFQAQDQQDWMNRTGRYAPPQQPQPSQQDPSQPSAGAQPQGDPQQAPQPQQQDQQPQQGQQPPQPAPLGFPAARQQALADYLRNMGAGNSQPGTSQDGQQAAQQAGQSAAVSPAMLATVLRGGNTSNSSDAQSPASPAGASVPPVNGKGDPAPGQLGNGPTAGGVGFLSASSIKPSTSAYARVLAQNTGAAGGMPDPMSDPSIRYLSVGASRGYVPDEVAGKAVDNFYRMNDNRTDFEKHLISNGVMPGTPAWDQAHQDLLKKDTYTAPVAVAQGTTMIDPYTHKVIIQSPKMAEGVKADYTNPASPSAVAVPGYAAANAANVGAARRAEQSNTVFTGVPGEGGKPMSGYGGALFGGGGSSGPAPAGAPGQQSGPAPAPAAPNGMQRPAPNQGNAQRPSGIISGQSQTDKLLTDQGGQMYGKIMSENEKNAQYRSALNEIYGLAQTGKFGPGTEGMARVKALASNLGVDLTGAQTDQDVFKKLSYSMAMSQLGQGGTGTNQQMDGILNQVPNGGMTNNAISKVVPMLVSQIDAREARGNVANQFLNNGGQMSQLPAYLSKFNAIADPGTISAGKAMAAAVANGQGKQAGEALKQKYPQTYQSVINRIHQLDEMGAF